MSRNKFVKGHARIKIKPELSGSSVAAFLKRDGIALFYLSDSGATGLCGESDFFNRSIMALPCQQQALCIAVAHPVGGKFRWQHDVQFAADRIESGQGDRLIHWPKIWAPRSRRSPPQIIRHVSARRIPTSSSDSAVWGAISAPRFIAASMACFAPTSSEP